jgi:hypothetical protein
VSPPEDVAYDLCPDDGKRLLTSLEEAVGRTVGVEFVRELPGCTGQKTIALEKKI